MGLDNHKAAWLDAIAARGVRKSFDAGTAISLQDDIADQVGFILSGKAKAVAYSESGDETWLALFSEGDFFGHTSFLTQMPTHFEMTAESDVTAILFKAETIKLLLGENAGLSEAVARDLAGRLQTMIQRLIEALTLSARGRICAELIRLSAPIGIDPSKDIIRPNPVFVELALRVSSTRETVSRTVSELQKQGVVSREPGALLIQRPDALKAAVR